MTTNQGIFQAEPNPTPVSPFVGESAGHGQAGPFEAVESSPFAMVNDASGARTVEPGRPAKLPEKRPKAMDSPFQMVGSLGGGEHEGAGGFAGSPFEPSPPSAPFALAQPAAAGPAGYQVPPPFGAWPQPQQQPGQVPQMMPQFQASPPPQALPVPQVFAPVQALVGAAAPAPTMHPAEMNSSTIRQIELRAIFGVDREMGQEEILQRVRALPGIRHVARLDAHHLGALEALRQVLASLGFGTGGLRIYAGSCPVEFIREGNVILAVQTDGGFAPGIRETLMIVAREFGKSV